MWRHCKPSWDYFSDLVLDSLQNRDFTITEVEAVKPSEESQFRVRDARGAIHRYSYSDVVEVSGVLGFTRIRRDVIPAPAFPDHEKVAQRDFNHWTLDKLTVNGFTLLGAEDGSGARGYKVRIPDGRALRMSHAEVSAVAHGGPQSVLDGLGLLFNEKLEPVEEPEPERPAFNGDRGKAYYEGFESGFEAGYKQAQEDALQAQQETYQRAFAGAIARRREARRGEAG